MWTDLLDRISVVGSFYLEKLNGTKHRQTFISNRRKIEDCSESCDNPLEIIKTHTFSEYYLNNALIILTELKSLT